MKKTLIALAVAASAAVSGSAIAAGWVPNGTGGTVELGGTLTVIQKTTPWSVKVGGGVSDLNAQVQKGQKVVYVPVKKPVLFLGITPTEGSFKERKGINPQIDYNGFVDINGFDEGVTKVKLPIKNKEQKNIGNMEADFNVAALVQWKYFFDGARSSTVERYSVYANKEGQGFFGGVGKNAKGVLAGSKVADFLNKLDPEITNSIWAHTKLKDANTVNFDNMKNLTQSYYGSGIVEGTFMKITLDTAVSGNEKLEWHATMPIRVVYQ